MVDYEKLVGAIYDCAANPAFWPVALSQIRDAVNGAYALVGFVDTSNYVLGSAPFAVRHNSSWDEEWLIRLERSLAQLPDGGGMFATEVDVAWTQLSASTEAEFHSRDFYKQWVQPQGLRDTINIPYVLRSSMTGMLSVPSYATREPYGEADCQLIETLSPHIRRAMMINDIVDKGKMATTLYRKVLDTLSAAVFVVGLGRRLIFTNAAGDALLREDNLLGLNNQVLQAKRSGGAETALDIAMDRALKGDAAIGIAGIGVPLSGADDVRTAAYVLPIAGNDLRGDMGPGHCAVFVARRGEQQPLTIEILRTVFDLTVSEARVATLLAKGEKPQSIAATLDVSVNTVRSHLKHTFAKTDTADQTALSALIHSVLPPVAEV